ncbi:SIMPL domain-containing protein [Pseudoduganella sp. RAF53_2]|uniref:SIMPL domain-containing protein n=1 Tax=unclassified Pseudoduganella TaxID=2637179 RepID=UPI003F9A8AF5
MAAELMRRALAAWMLCSALAAQASTLPEYPFVSTSGRAQTWLAPDIGELQFEIGAQNVMTDAASADLDNLAATVQKVLAAHTIPDTDVESFELGKKSVTLAQAAADGATQAWLLSRQYRVQVRDLSQWGAVLTELLALDHLDSIKIAFDRTDRDRINKDLMADAAKDARTNGELLAESFGRKLGPATAISRAPLEKVGAPYLAPQEPAPRYAPRASASYSVSPANVAQYLVPISIPFGQSVNAIFRLK